MNELATHQRGKWLRASETPVPEKLDNETMMIAYSVSGGLGGMSVSMLLAPPPNGACADTHFYNVGAQEWAQQYIHKADIVDYMLVDKLPGMTI